MEKKETKQIIVTSALVLVLLITVSNAVNKSKQRKNNAAIKAAEAKIKSDTKPDENIVLYAQLEEEAKKVRIRRDPFSSMMLLEQEPRTAKLYLKGIIWDKEHPFAIINDDTVSIGDRFADNEVMDIQEQKVILKNSEKTFELTLE